MITVFDAIVRFLKDVALGVLFVLSFFGIETDRETIAPLQNEKISVQYSAVEEAALSPEIEKTATIAEPQAAEKVVDTQETREKPPPKDSLAVSAPSVESAPPVAERTPLISQSVLNEAARKTIVNIFCLTKTTGVFSPLSGSGIIIDERGVVLTNAHVAQYFLLKDYSTKDFLSCVIRGGSPATPLYKAELLYLPPEWVEKNALNIKLDKPLGTGEHDFALILITESTSALLKLPGAFPTLPIDVEGDSIIPQEPLLLASYPAGFLGGLDITKNLWLTSTVARIGKLYTFRETFPYTKDSFSVGGTIVAQEGASGGGVFSLRTGKLVGVISTGLLEGTTSERDLRAISISHINESMKRFTGSGLKDFLSGDLKQKSSEFNEIVAPELAKILTDLLDKDR